MALYTVRSCLHCGNQFTPLSSRQKHCGPACRFRDVAKLFDGVVECWEWPASRAKSGYGQFTWTPAPMQMVVTAHRASYSLFVADIPTGMCVMHKCDNRGCFNPAHLAAGTLADNNRDMHKKQRSWCFDSVKRITVPQKVWAKRRAQTNRRNCTPQP